MSGFDSMTGVRPLILLLFVTEPFVISPATKRGLLDLVRARLSRLESDPEPSFSSVIGSGRGDSCLCFFAADLVTGAKYPSWCFSETSEGVGDGEITFGVEGIGYGKDIASVCMKPACPDFLYVMVMRAFKALPSSWVLDNRVDFSR